MPEESTFLAEILHEGRRRPLGLAVVGGLLFNLMLMLFVPPVFFTCLDQFQRWMARALPALSGRAGLPEVP